MENIFRTSQTRNCKFINIRNNKNNRTKENPFKIRNKRPRPSINDEINFSSSWDSNFQNWNILNYGDGKRNIGSMFIQFASDLNIILSNQHIIQFKQNEIQI